jgi:hypothetical protein
LVSGNVVSYLFIGNAVFINKQSFLLSGKAVPNYLGKPVPISWQSCFSVIETFVFMSRQAVSLRQAVSS